MDLKSSKIVITGAAGLVGQNLILLMREQGYQHIIALDKEPKNTAILQRLNPGITVIEADLADPGSWQAYLEGTQAVIQLHAQITSQQAEVFIRNNIIATQNVLAAMKTYRVPYLIHISSSVVNSVAEDDYTHTKIAQEQLALDAGIPCCVLRPTLMFGWFDRKHLGWLARFMQRVPVFPIPGHGRYVRQPLYGRDFCRVILSALENPKPGQIFDIVGQESITYIDMIRLIKRIKFSRTWILRLPVAIFTALLRLAGLVMKNPPFTEDQLKALMAGDYFEGIDFQKEFGVKPTPLQKAFTDTFTHPTYSEITLDR